MAKRAAGRGLAGGTGRPQERTRLEGEVRFYADGVEIAAGELERAVLEAGRGGAPVPPAAPGGWRLTSRGEGYVQALRELEGRVA